FALLNSPAGLAAYILEKFSTWTRAENRDLEDGGLTTKYSLDELLTNVMVYWATDSITSSMRYYKENIGSVVLAKNRRTPVTVPSGFAIFPEELIAFPEAVIGSMYTDVVTFTYHSKGGHFPAMEEPALLEKDLRSFVLAVEARNATQRSVPRPFPFVDLGPLAPKVMLTFGPETSPGAGTFARTRFEPQTVQKEPGKASQAARDTKKTGHIRNDCRVPRCDDCHDYSHTGENCVKSYAVATAEPPTDETTDLIMEEAEVELAATVHASGKEEDGMPTQ
ncbi:hypothetical protein HPB47_016103, partial [Ixodes persulcatus]